MKNTPASNSNSEIKPKLSNFIDIQVEKERIRLEKEAGVYSQKIQHFSAPAEKLFTADQRGSTTLLFGGLTWGHEHLVEGAFRGLGYKITAIPTPDVESFQTGKEYGNNGQCNPTYFTVGNLVKYSISKGKLLKELDILDFKNFHIMFEEDIFVNINPKNVVNARNSVGGTGFTQVQKELTSWKSKLSI